MAGIIALEVTYRLKVALVGGSLVALGTWAATLAARRSAAKWVHAEVRETLRRAQVVAESTQRLRSLELVAAAEGIAGHEEFRSLFDPGQSVQDRARATFVAIEGHNARLDKAGRKADLILVVDAAGKVIARDMDPRALWGEDLGARFPAVVRALSGTSTTGLWLFDGKMMHVAVTPISSATGVLGALTVGYVVNARQARTERDLLGADVAYFLDGRVHASSLEVPGSRGETGEGAEDVELVAATSEPLFSKGGAIERTLEDGRPGEVLVPTALDGRYPHHYLVRVGVLHAGSTARAGYFVLASVTERLGTAYRRTRVILLVGLVALVVLFASVFVLGKHAEKSLDRVEVGVSEIISGNLDYSFEAFDEFEGLCNGLNVMVARLLGRPDPTDDSAPGPDDLERDVASLSGDEPSEEASRPDTSDKG